MDGFIKGADRTQDISKGPAMSDEPKEPAAEQQDYDKKPAKPAAQKEVGGRKGPEPTRYGDWEKNGLISDF